MRGIEAATSSKERGRQEEGEQQKEEEEEDKMRMDEIKIMENFASSNENKIKSIQFDSFSRSIKSITFVYVRRAICVNHVSFHTNSVNSIHSYSFLPFIFFSRYLSSLPQQSLSLSLSHRYFNVQ